jgi:hypothetical protein
VPPSAQPFTGAAPSLPLRARPRRPARAGWPGAAPCLRRRVGAEPPPSRALQRLVGGEALACSPPRPRPTCTSGAPPVEQVRGDDRFREAAARRGSPVASDASAAASRTWRSSSRSCSRPDPAQSAYGSSLIAVPADSSSCARLGRRQGQRRRCPACHSACSQNLAAASRSRRRPVGQQPGNWPAALMSSAPSTARSLLTMVATFCSVRRAARRRRISTIRSAVTRPGRSTASACSVRDFGCRSRRPASWTLSRTTLNVPARARRRRTCGLIPRDQTSPHVHFTVGVLAARKRRQRRDQGRRRTIRPERGRHALTVAPDRPRDRRRPGDVAAGGLRRISSALVRVEVA